MNGPPVIVFAKAENTMQKSADSSVKANNVLRCPKGIIPSIDFFRIGWICPKKMAEKLASRF
jgi:hypothetical protein